MFWDAEEFGRAALIALIIMLLLCALVVLGAAIHPAIAFLGGGFLFLTFMIRCVLD